MVDVFISAFQKTACHGVQQNQDCLWIGAHVPDQCQRTIRVRLPFEQYGNLCLRVGSEQPCHVMAEEPGTSRFSQNRLLQKMRGLGVETFPVARVEVMPQDQPQIIRVLAAIFSMASAGRLTTCAVIRSGSKTGIVAASASLKPNTLITTEPLGGQAMVRSGLSMAPKGTRSTTMPVSNCNRWAFPGTAANFPVTMRRDRYASNAGQVSTIKAKSTSCVFRAASIPYPY